MIEKAWIVCVKYCAYPARLYCDIRTKKPVHPMGIAKKFQIEILCIAFVSPQQNIQEKSEPERNF